jgi:ERCC4-related helicase
MNPKMLKAMRAKKKRAVDPNAPPRPNLLSHDKKIRDMEGLYQSQISELRSAVEKLERKLRHQTNYLDALHAKLSGRK